ncbi:hypothetical protein ABFA07_015641 [Porites harrisoni]
MRNHLAEDVLSKKMLYLLQAYERYMSQDKKVSLDTWMGPSRS